jgi:hypothetical protein
MVLIMTDMRINARLDEETSNDLLFLRQELGETSVTDVLKYSLKRTAQELRDKLRAKSQKQIWLTSGFIGCIDGAEDLSSNYKHYVAEAVDEKYSTQE